MKLLGSPASNRPLVPGPGMGGPVLEPPGIGVLTGTPGLPGPEAFLLCETQGSHLEPLWARSLEWGALSRGCFSQGFCSKQLICCRLPSSCSSPWNAQPWVPRHTAEAAAWAGRARSAGVFGMAIWPLGSSGQRPPAVGWAFISPWGRGGGLWPLGTELGVKQWKVTVVSRGDSVTSEATVFGEVGRDTRCVPHCGSWRLEDTSLEKGEGKPGTDKSSCCAVTE